MTNLTRSHELLFERLGTTFFRNQFYVLFDPYLGTTLPIKIHNKITKKINIVLAGNFIGRLIDFSLWPEHDYKLWVLCHRGKKVLENIYPSLSGKIGVVPRYVLFPIQAQVRDIIFTEPINFIFAGRFTRSKGIFNLLQLVSDLQVEVGLPCKLTLKGYFCEAAPPNLNWTRISEKDFKRSVTHLLTDLPWMDPPSFEPFTASKNWIRTLKKNSVFISLSQHFTEDFGVSLAQAQAEGIPAFISGWGAHLDANTENSYIFDKFELAENIDALKQSKEKLLNNAVRLLSRTKPHKVRSGTTMQAQTVSVADVQAAIVDGQFGGNFSKFAQKGFHGYQADVSGRKFFSKFNTLFGADL